MSEPLDLLIIGSGACGLAAAIAAHDAGATVAIVEKEPRIGGNSALSTGSIPGAGTRYQRAAGIEDSPARLIADLERVAGPHDAPDLTALVAHECAGLCEWLIDELGVAMELITAYRHVGHSVERLHAPRSRRGADLVDDLARCVAERDIPLALGNPATGLLSADGCVTGALVAGEPIAARSVLLATNGFAADRALVARHCPDIAAATYYGAPGSTGEAVRWGETLGAAFGNMAAYQGYAAVVVPQGQLLSWTTIEKGGILVDGKGERFGNEDAGYSGFAPNVLAEGAEVFAVFDARIDDIASAEEEHREMGAMGAIRWDEEPARLGASAGLDGAALERTLARYGEAARGRRPDAFGRTHFGLAPLTPPFALVRVAAGLFHTQGGLLVDADARVRRRVGGVIDGLFAGGGAAAGISGRAGAAGYASGNGLVTALVLGRRAGLAAARASV